MNVQLQWAFGQGAAEVQVQFSEKVTISVSAATLQAVVLLNFNAHSKITVRFVPGGLDHMLSCNAMVCEG